MNDDRLRALRAINEICARQESAGLIRGVLTSGLLHHCRVPTHPAELAGRTGLDGEVMARVCDALCSFGVLIEPTAGQVQVSSLYAPLLTAGLDRRAVDGLRGAAARAGLLERLFETEQPTSYWEVDDPTRIALARSVTRDPETEFGRLHPVEGVRAEPDWEAEFDRGGRFLDLGCGVAGQTVSYLQHWPDLTAVGLDLANDLLEVARARAQACGVSDRVAFVHTDAAAYRDPRPFDVAFWPQTFFSRTLRAPALQTAFECLRPGGLLITLSAGGAPARSPAEAGTNLSDGRLLEPVMRSLWDIPERTPDQVKGELTAAGFVDVEDGADLPLITPRIKARRPAAR